MTTAGRPTFESARGGAHQGARLYVPSQKYSKLDAPGHLVLKERHAGQGAPDELDAHALAARLLAEDDAAPRALPPAAPAARIEAPPAAKEVVDMGKEKEDVGHDTGGTAGTKRPAPAPSLDADDSDDEEDDEDEDNSEDGNDDDDDDEDETEALLAELERIKQERQAEQARQEEAAAARVKAEAAADAATSNPLLVGLVPGTEHAQSAVVRKKWYEETVFKNQSRGEPEQKKRFVNDTVRNDFHLRFLHRYLK